MSKITEMMAELASPILSELGLELWDVEFVKEASDWYLRVFIDSPDGVDLDSCEKVTRYLNPLLDEREDMFPDEGYIFEVGSAGAERRLKRPSDFIRFIGHRVEIKLYKSKLGKKEFTGILADYNDGAIVLESDGESIAFEKSEIAGARLRI